MSQVNNYICAIIMLLSFSVFSQNSVDDDPETIINSINYGITQSQHDIDNSNFFEAQGKLDNALKLAVKIDDKKSIGLINSKIGKLHYIIEEPNEAIKWLTKAVEVQRFAKDDANLAETYKSFGIVYNSKGDYNQALEYFTSAKSLFQQEGLHNYVAEVLLNEGKTYIKQKNYRKAKVSFEQALVIAKRYNLEKIQSGSLVNSGKVTALLGDDETALSLANEGLAIAKNNRFHDVVNESYIILSEINKNLENYKLSNEYLRLYINNRNC